MTGSINRLRVRENGGDPIVDFAYDSAGRRISSGWAATTSYAYDPAGRLQTLSHDLAGTSRDQTQSFTYNPASQILTRSASNDAYAWTGAVNTSRPYAVNGLNQYKSAGAATFDYDPNGNLASTANAPWSTAYVYDVENRLVSASGSHNAELVYDPLGRLFQVSSGASVRRLVYDGDALIAEYEPGGTMVHRYIHGNDAKADDPLVWYDNFASGWRRALLADHQGSIVQVADMYGNPIATNTYDPWGFPGSTPAGRFGYTGQAWMPELGLWYYKARFYSSTIGRFLQVDPVGYEDQVNLYAYVGNDPVNATDPSGECVEKDGQKVGVCGDGPLETVVNDMIADPDSSLGKVDRAAAEAGSLVNVIVSMRDPLIDGVGTLPGENPGDSDVLVDLSETIRIDNVDKEGNVTSSRMMTTQEMLEHDIGGHVYDAVRDPNAPRGGGHASERSSIEAENRYRRKKGVDFQRESGARGVRCDSYRQCPK